MADIQNISDDRWRLVEPIIYRPCGVMGRQSDLRGIFFAVRWKLRTGATGKEVKGVVASTALSYEAEIATAAILIYWKRISEAPPKEKTA